MDAEVGIWKEKCHKLEKQLSTLKKLAHKAIADYDDLHCKYKDNITQLKEVKKTLAEREDQLKKLQEYLEPVYNEYDEIRTKYQIEHECRAEAERYASKINKENTKLKRESQALFAKLGEMRIDVLDIPIDIAEEPTKENELQFEEYNKKIQGNAIRIINHALKKGLHPLVYFCIS
ncbi:shootin-1-like [Lingula anatina]|uniref:Shootin-1-like n=1 Tax=Lingula anatina TaxID=7574 RepID=A0A1S3KEP2_LINAN|nr:shootin-1-like [Lingula anatina]|eukprot:XP_013420711.1 shootin-1-like [Lingula anatina]